MNEYDSGKKHCMTLGIQKPQPTVPPLLLQAPTDKHSTTYNLNSPN